MSETTQKPASAEDIAEVIAGLEQYRQRIIDDGLEMAKRVKLPKKEAMAQLAKHPDIIKIDANLERLRSRQGAT
ncbi:MAG: acetyltransferase [Hormoscilla sp.]